MAKKKKNKRGKRGLGIPEAPTTKVQRPNVPESSVQGEGMPQISYPTVTPRISQDDGFNPYLDIKRYWAGLGVVVPKIPYQVFDIVDHLVLTDPYINKYHNSTVALANSGHEIQVSASSVQRAIKAIDACNEMAQTCFPNGANVTGLVTSCFSQLCRSGATCVEWVPDPGLNKVNWGFLVPIKTIRFTFDPDNDGYILCQQQIGIHEEHIGIVPLNMNQTIYYNPCIKDGLPYATPPLISAIEPAATHKNIIEKIGKWMSKLSALGVMLAEVAPPPRLPGETQEMYDQKAQTYLDKIAASVSQNMASGLGIAYNNVKFSFSNTQAGAAGAEDLLKMVLLGLFAGLNRDPIMFGWNTNNSDSYIKVIYEELMRSLAFYQTGVKAVLEKGYRLNLALRGMSDCNVTASFNAVRSLDQFRDSEADYMDSKKILEQLQAMAITPEEARSKLGYDQAVADENTFSAQFSENQGRYIFQKKDPHFVQVIDNLDTNYTKKDYKDRLTGLLKEASDKGFLVFSAWIGNLLELNKNQVVTDGIDTYIKATENSIDKNIVSVITAHWDRQNWNEADPTPSDFSTKTDRKDNSKTDAELAALMFLGSVLDPYLITNYLSRSEWRQETIRNAISQLYDKYDLDNPTAENINAFRRDALKLFSKVAEDTAQMLSQVGGDRARSWATMFGMQSDGVERFRIVGPDDARTCGFCRAMIGREFSVVDEIRNITAIVNKNETDLGETGAFITKRFESLEEVENASDKELQESGLIIPPYHPRCRHWAEPI